MTLALYARRKGWPLEGVTIELQHSRIYAADCADCETKDGRLDRIETSIALAGRLADEQRARLLEIAQKCPVHRTLTSEVDIQTRLAAGSRRGVEPATPDLSSERAGQRRPVTGQPATPRSQAPMP
jgi:putative redox protein